MKKSYFEITLITHSEMVAFCSSTPLTSVRNLNFNRKGCLHSLPCPRGNKSSIFINMLNDQSHVSGQCTAYQIVLQFVVVSWPSHMWHLDGFSISTQLITSWSVESLMNHTPVQFSIVCNTFVILIACLASCSLLSHTSSRP